VKTESWSSTGRTARTGRLQHLFSCWPPPGRRAETLRKIERAYALRDDLDSAWAVRPLSISEQDGQMKLVLEDPGGETLDRLLPGPLEMTQFSRLAAGVARALSGVHKRELIHKDIKPVDVLVEFDRSNAHHWKR
jgi:serine/threonine protein kinase